LYFPGSTGFPDPELPQQLGRPKYIEDALTRYATPNAEARLFKGVLPGSTCPELWALDTVRANGVEAVVTRFGLDSAHEAAVVLAGCGLSDPHAIPYELSKACRLAEDTASTYLAAVAARVAVDARQGLVDIVESALG